MNNPKNPVLLLVKTSKFENVLDNEYLELDILGQVNDSETKTNFLSDFKNRKLFVPKWFLEQKGLFDQSLYDRAELFILLIFLITLRKEQKRIRIDLQNARKFF